MIKSFVSVTLLCLILLATNCAGWSSEVTQKIESWTVKVLFNPDPPKMGKNTIKISILNDKGKPLSKAKVSLHFSMPGMGMDNMGKAKGKEVAPGNYEVQTILSMEGEWLMKITFTPKNGKKNIVSVPFKV